MNGQAKELPLSEMVIDPWREAGAMPTIPLRCPHCGNNGAFAQTKSIEWDYVYNGVATHIYAGPRICPNPECMKLVFIVTKGKEADISFPPQVLDFDPKGVPENVELAISEAITCHANSCFRASALMLRRALEEICADRNAEGADLYKRLEVLGKNIVMPAELVEALHELRILGNDAAHIEARVYDDIGQEEVEVAIDLTKEIVKATYQYVGLLARMRALKAQPAE